MRRASVAALLCVTAWAIPAGAQVTHRRFPPPPSRAPAPAAALSEDPRDLRSRFGVALAARLIQSNDADERLRGVERAAAIGSPDAIALLARARDASLARTDGRTEIAAARGLAMHVDQPAARAALLAIVDPPAAARAPREDELRDPLHAAQMDVARRIAALALAQSGDTTRIEKLTWIARGTGAGAEAAEAALVAFPASVAAAWGKLTPRAMLLLARTGDRRASSVMLDLAATRTNDPESRAAAIEALAALGDARVLDVSRSIKGEDDPRLRIAAASALVTLGAPEAAGAVEQLMADDLTAGRGIALAADTHGAGLVRALAAQASVTTDHAVRAASIAALGRDPTSEGIEALVALARDPGIRTEAMDAIAHSPSPSAMPALETLAGDTASRRVAVRAYVIRVSARDERSGVLARAVDDLARAVDARDRSVGAFARVALGSDRVSAWIDDRDPQVRRAAASGAMATPGTWTSDARDALLARRAHEEDPVTRAVLGAALGDGQDAHRAHESTAISSVALLACARAGGADAAACTFAFARRAGGDEASLELLLRSRDPVVRANAVRGLASGDAPTRAGRLAQAYAYETSPLVRRTIVAGFATTLRTAPAVADVLTFAARFDPDATVRWISQRVGANEPVDGAGGVTDTVWLHVMDPSGAPPAPGLTGTLVRSDGIAIPVAFDADGDALVPGIPAGSARLVLAPQLGAAYAPTP